MSQISNIQRQLLEYIKIHGYMTSVEDISDDRLSKLSSKELIESIQDLLDRGFIQGYIGNYLSVTNAGYRLMGWIDEETVQKNEERIALLEGKLKEVIQELSKIRPVQFLDYNSEFVYDFDAIIESYADNRVYIRLI